MPGLISRIVAGAGLVVLAVPFALIALAVRLDSPGPALHRSLRAGRDGRSFQMLKFRTMGVSGRGMPLTLADDARITRVGRRLRRYRIDELPQLWNVLTGTMALVGPRPEDPRYVDLDDQVWREVLSVMPGITGPTQLRFRNEAQLLAGPDPDATYRGQILPVKLLSDLAYVRDRSMRGDMQLLWETLRWVGR